MFIKFGFVTIALALVGCSSPVEEPSADDAGPTWLDVQPATLPYDAGPDVALKMREASADAYTPQCSTTDSCGGSWRGFTCPSGYVPPPESHCTFNDTDAQPGGVWCCYGAVAP